MDSSSMDPTNGNVISNGTNGTENGISPSNGNYGNGDSNTTITGPEDLDPESQRRHYSMLKQLQSMAKYTPIDIQQRLPNELLSNLAISLLDPTVIKIVSYLRIQQNGLMDELNQIDIQKTKLIDDKKRQQMEKITKHFLSGKITSDKMSELIKIVENKHKVEIVNMVREIGAKMEECIAEQQQILESAKIPGFYLTDRTTDIKVMKQVLEFILKLDTKAI